MERSRLQPAGVESDTTSSPLRRPVKCAAMVGKLLRELTLRQELMIKRCVRSCGLLQPAPLAAMRADHVNWASKLLSHNADGLDQVGVAR